jgi:hypothetical protein
MMPFANSRSASSWHGNWYDTHLYAIGAPEGLASHWSRLVDAGVAAVILAVALVAELPEAELAAQIVWPLLLLAVFTRFVMGEAERRGGSWASIMLLALVLASPTALSQFLPGRIDHHNVQIMCAVIAVFLLARAMRAPRHGWAAGAVMAVGLVVGLEALPLMAAILAFACLISCFDTAARPGIVRALAGLLAGLLAGYLLAVPPSDWLASPCDVLAPNLIALVAAGAAAGVVMYWRLPQAQAWVWLPGYGVAAIVGAAAYFGANPACMASAFADVDPLVREVWLANVMESYSIACFAVASPAVAVSYVVVVTLGALAAIWQARESQKTSDVFLAIATVLAALYGCYYIKFMSYGVWLALVATAIVLARLPSIGKMLARLSRVAALVFCNQLTALAVAGMALGLFAASPAPAVASNKPSFTGLAATCS